MTTQCRVYFYLSDLKGSSYSREIKKDFKQWANKSENGIPDAFDTCDVNAAGETPEPGHYLDVYYLYQKYKNLEWGSSSRSEPARRSVDSSTSDPPEDDSSDVDVPDTVAPLARDPTRSTIRIDTDDEDDFDIEGLPDDPPPPPPPTDFDTTKIFLKREVVANPNFPTFDFSRETLANLLNLIPGELRTPLLAEKLIELQTRYSQAAILNNNQVIVAVRPQTFYTRLPKDTHVVIPGIKPIANFGIPIATCTYLILTNTPSEFYRLDFNLALLPDGQPKAYTASLEKFGTEGGEEKSLYALSVDLMPIFTNPELLFAPPQKIKLRVHLSKEEGATTPNPQVESLTQAYTTAWSETPPTVKIFDMSQEDYNDLLQNPFIPQLIKDVIDTNALETSSPGDTTIPGGPLADPSPIREESLE